MNIDDFLEKASGSDKLTDDIINITSEDIESVESIVRAKPEIDSSQGTSNTSAQTVDSKSSKEVSKPALEPAPSSPISVKSESLVKSSAPLNSEDLLQQTFSGVISALKNKDLQLSMNKYRELRSLYDSIPLKNITAKKELHSVLLSVNEKISHLSEYYHHITEKLIFQIESLIHSGEHSLHDADLVAAVVTAKKIKDVYSKIPIKSDPLVMSLKSHIYKYWSDVQDKTRIHRLHAFKKSAITIQQHVDKSQKALSDKNISLANSLLDKAEQAFSELSDEDTDIKMHLHHNLTKQKYAIDVIMQIHSLQKELKGIPGFESDQIKASSNQRPISSKTSVAFKKPFVTHIPEQTITRPIKHFTQKQAVGAQDKIGVFVKEHSSQLKTHSQVQNNSVSSVKPISSSHSNSFSENQIAALSLKKIKLKKIKLDILRKNYDLARKTISSLEQQFGNDSDISHLKLQLAKHMKEYPSIKPVIDSSVDSEIEQVEQDISKGDFYSAEEDLSKFKSTHEGMLYKSFATEVEKDVEQGEQSYYLTELKKRLTEKRHSPGLDDSLLKQIARRVILAKHHIKKGNAEKAKSILKDIFRIDPDNKDAKEILEMVTE